MSLASNFARSVKVELIAKLVTSYEAYDGGTLIKNVAPHNVRDYFRKYGSTARKFDHIEGDDIYVGYVRMPGKPEFLSAIVLAGEHAVAVSFDSETDDSNDFLTLMAKKEFAERMTAAVQRASAIMRKVVAPTPPPAPRAPETPPPETKSDQTFNKILPAIIVVAIGAGLFALWAFNNQQGSQRQLVSAPYISPTYDPIAPNSGSQPYPRTDSAMPVESSVTEHSSDATVTMGMLDSIMTGVDSFNAAHTSDGMLGAITRSQECWSSVSSATDMTDLDKCAAFDIAAQLYDQSASANYGFPLQSYFTETNARVEQAYARFPASSIQRLALIKGETAKVLLDSRR